MSRVVDLKGALKVLAAAMRGEPSKPKEIDLVAVGKELVANEKLTAKQFELVQAMDAEQQTMVKTLLDAMLKSAAEDPAAEDATDPGADPATDPTAEDMAKAAAAKAAQAAQASTVVNEDAAKKLDTMLTAIMTKVDGLTTELNTIKANQGRVVSETLQRNELIAKLVANEASPFDVADLEAMTTDVLKKLEAKMRPADYSGQGAFASNLREVDGDSGGALRVNTGYLLVKPKKDAA